MLLWSGIICLLLIFHPLLSVNAVSRVATNSIDSLKQQRQQINKQRQNVKQESDRLTNLQKEAEKRLTGLETNLKVTNSNIKDSEFRLQQATNLLQSLQADLATAEVAFRNINKLPLLDYAIYNVLPLVKDGQFYCRAIILMIFSVVVTS